MASVLAFYFDDLSSNPAEAYSFFLFFQFVFEKNEIKQKEAHLFKHEKNCQNRFQKATDGDFRMISIRRRLIN